jgi:hypothetical protein
MKRDIDLIYSNNIFSDHQFPIDTIFLAVEVFITFLYLWQFSMLQSDKIPLFEEEYICIYIKVHGNNIKYSAIAVV